LLLAFFAVVGLCVDYMCDDRPTTEALHFELGCSRFCCWSASTQNYSKTNNGIRKKKAIVFTATAIACNDFFPKHSRNFFAMKNSDQKTSRK